MSTRVLLVAVVVLVCSVVAHGQDDPNLVGYWNFDDGAVTDLSGYGNDGALMGGAAVSDFPDLVFGGSGYSLDTNYQNRNTDWAEIPHSESLNITHELTILAWIRPDDIENNDGVITKGMTHASWALRFNITNGLRFTGNAGFNLDDPTADNYAPGALGTGDRQSIFEVPEVNVPAGIEWTFIGVVSDTQSLRFVLNLEEEVLPAAYIFAESDEPLVLGTYLPGDDYYNGLMDEVRIYNRALSRREVIALSGLAGKPFEPGPADGAVGVMAADLSWGSIEGADTLYLGTDPDALDLVMEDAVGSYTLADAAAGQTYYWRVDVMTADGPVTGDVWSFTMTEEGASGPAPSDNADFVDFDGLSLSWLPVVGATGFDVYFGTAPDALELQGRVTENAYEDPDKTMVSETLHYWRVDTIKGDHVVTGPLWRFKTMPVFAVEEALTAWYKFELGEGTTAVDWTRNGNEGVLVGDTTWVEDGYSGGALQFDGAADYVEIPRVVQDDWTIMLWLRTENLEQSWPGRLGTVDRVRNGVGLVDGDAGGPDENFAFSLNGDRIVANCMAVGQGDGGSLASNERVSAGDWYHAAWTRNATTGDMALFLNGVLDNSGQNDKWIGTKNAQDYMWIGGLQFGNRQQYLDGYLDEIKFFTRVLDEAEVKDEMRPDKRLAFLVEPADGALLGQESSVVLAWITGDGATAHNVYLGTAADQLELVSPSQSAVTYDAGLLEPATYYWQVGEVQADGAEVKGSVWSFAVADYLIVDDFESYTDEEGSRIYETWIDGWTNGTGAVVGYLEMPFAEQQIVHGGLQSMPIEYNNVNSPWYSEAERTWETPQDWTRRNSGALTLSLHGYPAPFLETSPGSFVMGASGDDIWSTADQFRFAFKRLDGDGSIVARVENVTDTHGWAKAGVMIRESLTAGSVHAAAVVTPSNGVSFPQRAFPGDVSVQVNQTGVEAPMWVRLTRTGDRLTAEHSADGTTWVDVGPDADASSARIPMMGTVYIGLCLTSHNVDAVTTAAFSEIATTGGVSGSWQVADIGADHPGNSPDTLYVAVEDAAGKIAVVSHSDLAAVTAETWTEWTIPLSDFSSAGVDVAKVKTLFLGVGDRDNPQPNGAGRIFIDDIRLTRVAPEE